MKKIKEWRKVNGVRQYQLAETLGISTVYLSMIETGKRRPSKSLAKLIDLVTQAA